MPTNVNHSFRDPRPKAHLATHVHRGDIGKSQDIDPHLNEDHLWQAS